MCKIIAVTNQKGGVGKTTTTANLGVGLAMKGKRVLLIDADAQGDLTICLGYQKPDMFEKTLTTILKQLIQDELEDPFEVVVHHKEGIDLVPCNIELSGMEVSLVNVMGREYILKQYLDQVKDRYDYILIDCSPSLGMVTINALTAADSVLIPVEAEYLPAKGLEQLIRTIRKTRNIINPKLEIEGILMTMVDERTNLSREIMDLIQIGYDSSVKVFETKIPKSIRAAESTVMGTSIFKYDMKSKVASAYKQLVEEVLEDA